MGKSQFEKDAKDLGFTVEAGTISAKGFPPGLLLGATANVEQSTGEVSRLARWATPIGQRGQMHGKARIFITVHCPGGVTVVSEREPKHELAARRFVAQINAASQAGA